VSELLHYALDYARRGLSIVPTKDKRPVGKWKSAQETPADDEKLRELFSAPGINGLAVVLGRVSGELVCRDFDVQAAYDDWAHAHPGLAASLPTVATSRGRHLYFRGSSGFEKLPDGEYRGTSRQITVLPPSRHPSGKIYRWLIPLPDGELPIIDPFVVGLCNRESRENRAPPTPHQFSLFQTAEDAIAASLPTTEGARHYCVFKLARCLRAIPSFAGADMRTLRPIVEQWHRRALPVIGTKPFLDTWSDFVQGWPLVRVPAGQGVIETAFQRAMTTEPPSQAVELYGNGPIVLLASLCRELQRIGGASSFFYLDCRTAGRLIGVDHVTAWRFLGILCADGVLAAGAKGSSVKASRFRFLNL
jgi:hypothetical protein